MGRKTRVQKQSNDIIDIEPVEEPEDESYLQQMELERQDEETEYNLTIYDALMEYREQCSLPMLEYLSKDSFLNFVKFIEE